MSCRLPISLIGGVVALAAVAGCASGPGREPGDGPSRGDLARELFAPERNGLEVQRWRVPDADGVVATALSARAAGRALDDSTIARLERNGLRLVRVRETELDALQDDLRGVEVEDDDAPTTSRPRVGVSAGWHGQVLDWRELLTWDVGGAAVPLAVDGRVERVSGGQVVLGMRAWTMPMETGTVLHLELRPGHRRPPERGYEGLLAARRPVTSAFDALRIELDLEAGWAYLLTCATPGDVWPMDGLRNRATGGIGPGLGPGLGPGTDIELPPTIGTALLSVELDPPRRDIVVFLPRLPDAVDPATPPADGVTVGLIDASPHPSP